MDYNLYNNKLYLQPNQQNNPGPSNVFANTSQFLRIPNPAIKNISEDVIRNFSEGAINYSNSPHYSFIQKPMMYPKPIEVQVLPNHYSSHPTPTSIHKIDIHEHSNQSNASYFTDPHSIDSQASITVPNLLKCEICLKTFGNKEKWERHCRLHNEEMQFECKLCYKKFRTKYNLQNHEKIHGENGEVQTHTCSQCHKTFNHEDKLTVHMRIHTGEKPYKCKLCLKYFNHQSNLIAHTRTHREKQKLKCTLCKKVLDNEESFVKHQRIHTGEKPYKCSFCEKSFNHKSNLSTHEKHHIQPTAYTCNICHKSFRHQSNLNGHSKIHEKKLFQCEICHKTFFFKSNLVAHMTKHNIKDFSCKTCTRVFNTHQALLKHVKIHSPEKPYQCEHCDRRFNYKCNLTIHTTIHNPDNKQTVQLFACNYCSQTFIEEESLNEHEIEHLRNGTIDFAENIRKENEQLTDANMDAEKTEILAQLDQTDKKFMCRVCMEKFGDENSLIMHHRVHLCQKPEECNKCSKTLEVGFDFTVPCPPDEDDDSRQECDVCNKVFHRFEHLQVHFRTHTGKQPYDCKLCEKSFNHQCNLYKHMKTTHSPAESPGYGCEICGKMFQYKGSLKYHQKIHSEVKAFQCDKCYKQFNYRCNLESHLRVHNPGTNDV